MTQSLHSCQIRFTCQILFDIMFIASYNVKYRSFKGKQ